MGRLGVLELHDARGQKRHGVPDAGSSCHVVEPALLDACLDAFFEGSDDLVGDDGYNAGGTVEFEVLCEKGVLWACAGGGFAEEGPFFGSDIFGFEGLDFGLEGGEVLFVGAHVGGIFFCRVMVTMYSSDRPRPDLVLRQALLATFF